MTIEETFDITIPDADAEKIVLAIVAEQAGVSRDRLTKSTRFVNDLGMD